MKTLKLKWLLYFLGMRLSYRNRTNMAFQRIIGDRELVVQIVIRDCALNYYFHLSRGQVVAMAGEHDSPGLILAFPDIRCAHEILPRYLSDMPQLIYAINKGILTVQGDMGSLIWFSSLCEWAMEGQNASACST